MSELRIIIAGSRGFNNYDMLYESLSAILGGRYFPAADDFRIVSGGARGADQLGERFARDQELPLTRMIADWNTYGKRAGYICNLEMAKFAVEESNIGMLIAFWDGKSRGTRHMIDLAKKYKLEVHVVNTEGYEV